MTVVTGRRRIGKTQLLLRATEGQPTLYFFVARKTANISPDLLSAKAAHLRYAISELNSYNFNILGLSMEDM